MYQDSNLEDNPSRSVTLEDKKNQEKDQKKEYLEKLYKK